MKKILLTVVIILSAVVILLSSTFVLSSNNMSEEIQTSVNLDSSKEYNKIDDLVQDSHLVIKGEVISSEAHGSTEEKYTMEVSEFYLSEIENKTLVK